MKLGKAYFTTGLDNPALLYGKKPLPTKIYSFQTNNSITINKRNGYDALINTNEYVNKGKENG